MKLGRLPFGVPRKKHGAEFLESHRQVGREYARARPQGHMLLSDGSRHSEQGSGFYFQM